jgi:glycyl-tRNA synthetase alpha subunit
LTTRTEARAAGKRVAPTKQEIITRLHEFWAQQGCVLVQPYNSEVGAGTLNPATFLRVLGPEPWRAAYVEPSKRPRDGRWRESQPRAAVPASGGNEAPGHRYRNSIEAARDRHRPASRHSTEDDWEGRRWGLVSAGSGSTDGSRVRAFQQAGSFREPIIAEITYGLLGVWFTKSRFRTDDVGPGIF